MPKSIVPKRTVQLAIGITLRMARDKKVVTVEGEKNKETLEIIAKLDADYVSRQRKARSTILLRGQWRWCQNPQCSNAFYVRPLPLELGKGWYCSPECLYDDLDFGIVRSFKRIRNLSINELAGWFLDTILRALNKDRRALARLNALIDRDPETVKEILVEIYLPRYFAAQKIVDTYGRTKKGTKLKELRDVVLRRR